MCNHQHYEVDRLTSEPTEAECALAMFRTAITLRPFDGVFVCLNDAVLLHGEHGELTGQTTVDYLMRAGAEA